MEIAAEHVRRTFLPDIPTPECTPVFGMQNFELRPQIPTALTGSTQLIADHDLGLFWYVRGNAAFQLQ